MKENFKITFYIGIVFVASFLVFGLFLEGYSQGLLTSEKNIITIGGIANQNPKQVTLDVLENILGETQNDDVSINSLGFRGNEFTEDKPENTFRIFLLGGSQMFGTGATSDNTTIPGYIETFLNEEDKSFSIEVINSGLKGVNSYKELLLLQNMLLDFSPDLVIIYDGLNDLRAGNDSKSMYDNWSSMCNLGQNNNFDVIVTLQPIAGFGNKSLTDKEFSYVENGKDYDNNSLLDSINQYEMYANSLKELENCTEIIDLRFVFDDEIEDIYIDEAHVSDKGNSIVVKAMLEKITSNIPQEIVLQKSNNYETQKIEPNIFSEFLYVTETIVSNFEKKLMLTPFSTYENNNFVKDTKQSETIIVKTQTQFYEDEEIEVIIKIIPSEDSTNDKKIKIITYDKITDSVIHNVTYLMTISKNENELFTNYFFAENELVIEIKDTNNKKIEIDGERRYELDALVMNPNVQIIISGSFFDFNSEYEFNINLRTIHDPENYIFLNGFKAEIIP